MKEFINLAHANPWATIAIIAFLLLSAAWGFYQLANGIEVESNVEIPDAEPEDMLINSDEEAQEMLIKLRVSARRLFRKRLHSKTIADRLSVPIAQVKVWRSEWLRSKRR